MSLEDRLRALIRKSGPLSQPDYMTLCLHDPADGYYAVRPALGRTGDFVTAPGISQMFGELVGLWALETWRRLGSPAHAALVELGPGDATLTRDILRVARPRGWPDCVVLVEPSAPLRALQAEGLADTPVEVEFAAAVTALPRDRPLIVIANEVLDCLPARAYVRTAEGWVERRIGLDADDRLVFVLAPVAAAPFKDAPEGALIEHAPAQAALAAELAHRVLEQGGAALLIDYGRVSPEPGDTLQAVRAHDRSDPLSDPGRSDLTVWAEFDVVAHAVRATGAAVAGPVSQGDWLRRLGIEQRATMLSRARPDQAPIIARQLHRLTAPDQMGALFKALAIYRPGDPVPPGFEEAP